MASFRVRMFITRSGWFRPKRRQFSAAGGQAAGVGRTVAAQPQGGAKLANRSGPGGEGETQNCAETLSDSQEKIVESRGPRREKQDLCGATFNRQPTWGA
jgi:hypothetical protein